MRLTPTQERLARFMAVYQDQNAYPPTVREMADHCQTSTSVISYNLKQMEVARLVRHAEERARGWVLIALPGADGQVVPMVSAEASLRDLVLEHIGNLESLADGWVYALERDEIAAALRNYAAGLRAGLGAA